MLGEHLFLMLLHHLLNECRTNNALRILGVILTVNNFEIVGKGRGTLEDVVLFLVIEFWYMRTWVFAQL